MTPAALVRADREAKSVRRWGLGTFGGPVIVVLGGFAALMILPQMVDGFRLLEIAIHLSLAVLALSLALIWGFGGILCFGQAAFFGLGAYAYAVTALNMGGSTLAVVLSLALPGAFAALLGYFMFYGRISDVYMGVITLTTSLILYKLMGATAGPEYHVGAAPLGGFNGIPALPPLNLPGNPDVVLAPEGLFYVAGAVLLATYGGLTLFLASPWGRIVVAVRENERRAELLGYDTRRVKLAVFSLGAVIAGLSGCLFANWGAFVSPDVFSLSQSAQVIIWVIVGGLGTLVGPMIGCIAVDWLTTALGTQQTINTSLVLGGILCAFVLLVPRGVVPTVGDGLAALARWLRSRRSRRGRRSR